LATSILVAALGCGGDESTEDTAKSASAAKEAEVEYVYAGEWGSTGSGEGQFLTPTEIAIGPDGIVYAVDKGNARVQYFDASGNYLGELDRPADSGSPARPIRAAVAPGGTVYVLYYYGRDDHGHEDQRIQCFARTGSYLGDVSSVLGGFDRDTTAAFAPNGDAYVAEARHDRVHRFGPGGAYLGSWDGYGVRGGTTFDIDDADGLAVAPNGWVYVVDVSDYRIQYFTATGSLLGRTCFYEEPFRWPGDVALGTNGDIYVADKGNCRIVHLTADREMLTAWGKKGSGEGEFGGVGKIAVGPDGNVYVADCGNDCIQRFTDGGAFVRRYPLRGIAPGRPFSPNAVAVSPSGVIYALDTDDNRLVYLSPQGELLGAWGSEGRGDGEFDRPKDVAAAADGIVYVCDAGNNRVQYFTGAGSFLGKWGSRGSGEGQFRGPDGLTVAPNGNVYVSEGFHTHIQSFTPTGSVLSYWDGPYPPRPGGSHTDSSDGIAVSPEGDVYSADPYGLLISHSIKTLLEGNGPPPVEGTAVRQPVKLAVGPNGDVFVSSAWHEGVITRYSPLGRIKGSFGRPGSKAGEFYGPSGIAVAPDGTIYVADSGNDRLQYFRPFAGGTGAVEKR
jgi:sugar lactone lactonase YvrE